MRQILCPVVVGRHEELDVLQAALDAARAGRGRLVLLRGGAGVGKSRLTLQLEAAARSAGMRVLRGRAAASSSSVPFRPVAEALLGATRAAGPPDAPELAAYRSVLGALIPEWSTPGRPVADRGLLLQEAALRLLRVLAGAAGALLTLEDLHWADAETLALVEYLADNVAAERLLCLATMRSDEPLPAPTLPALLAARRNALVLALDRLPDADVDAMARAALDAPGLPDGLGRLLASRAEGVPFLVEEVLASCVASGALVRHRGVWELRTDRAPRVPETFQGMLRERLRSLGERDRAVLGAAAVLGRRFDWSLIGDAAGLDRGTVLSALRAAVDTQIVSPEDSAEDPGFRFRHALTREAVLQDLLPPERAELAARAARAIQRAHPGLPGPWCERAADLQELAGDRTAAARLLLESARRSLARTALASAESALDRARSLAGDDRDLTVEVDEVLVEVLSLAGKPDRAVQAGERLAASLARAETSPGRAGRARLSLGRALAGAGATDRALGELDEAARLARAAGDEGLLARVWSFRAQVEVLRGGYEAGIELASRALAIAERLTLSEVACECLDVLGRRASVRDHQRGVEVFRRELEIAERADLGLWKVRALLELGTVEMTSSGDIADLARAAALAEREGAVSALALQNQCWPHLLAGRWDDLAAANQRCAELCRRFGLGLLPHALIVTGLIHAARDELRDMEVALREAEDATDDPNIHGAAWGSRATLALLREDRGHAVDAFERAVGLLRRTQGVTNWHFLGTRAVLLELEGRGGEAARGELGGIGAPLAYWNEASLDQSEAIALGRAGRSRDGEAAARRAGERLRGAHWLRCLHARLLAEAAIADGWGDPVGWLRQALPVLESAGHDRVVAACKALLRRAGAPLPRKGRGESEVPLDLRSLGVTSREMDVLRLVADGLSNRDRRAARRARPGGGRARPRPRRRRGRARRPLGDRRRRPGIAGGPRGRRRGRRGRPGGRRDPVRLLHRHAVERHRVLRRRAVLRRGVPHPPRAGLHLGVHPRRRRGGGPPPDRLTAGGVRPAAGAFGPPAGPAAASRPPDLAGAGHAAPAQPAAPGVRLGLGAGRRRRLLP
jgi:tetratricopeptide (TPR) repeat protein